MGTKQEKKVKSSQRDGIWVDLMKVPLFSAAENEHSFSSGYKIYYRLELPRCCPYRAVFSIQEKNTQLNLLENFGFFVDKFVHLFKGLDQVLTSKLRMDRTHTERNLSIELGSSDHGKATLG